MVLERSRFFMQNIVPHDKNDTVDHTAITKGALFYPQFWNKNGWYGMLGIIRIVCIKKTPVEMRGPGTSKHCVTNMVADEEAAIAAVIAAIFLGTRN